MKNDSEVENLEEHLDREDASEDVVEVGQHHVSGHGNDGDGDDDNNRRPIQDS